MSGLAVWVLLGLGTMGVLAQQPRTVGGGAGVVEGMVIDAWSGKPIEGAPVVVGDGRQAVTAPTDASGRFSARVEAGSYTASVSVKGYAHARYGQYNGVGSDRRIDVTPGGTIRGIDLKLYPTSSVSGLVLDDEGRPVPGAAVELLAEGAVSGTASAHVVRAARTDAEGTYRVADLSAGTFFVRAYITIADGRPPIPDLGPTYYPGVSENREAQPVRVDAGQDLFGIDVTLVRGRVLHVAGSVVGLDAAAVKQQRVVFRPLGLRAPRTETVVRLDADARFRTSSLRPGVYMVRLDTSTPTSLDPPHTQVLELSEDVENLIIEPNGVELAGRFVEDDPGVALPDLSQARVAFYRALGAAVGQIGSARGNSVTSDGAFSGMAPRGDVAILAQNVPAGWMVRTVRVDGEEIDDKPTDLGSGPKTIEVVLTRRVTHVTGSLSDGKGRMLHSHLVVIFPDGHDTPLEMSPRLRHTLTVDGGFTIDGLPPGDYFAAAVADLPQDWRQPQVLERLRNVATPFRLALGERNTLALRAQPLPDGITPAR